MARSNSMGCVGLFGVDMCGGEAFDMGGDVGRVGDRGQSAKDEFGTQVAAVAAFKKKFKDKTGNNWGEPFVGKAGKYTLLHKDYNAEDDEAAPAAAEEEEEEEHADAKKAATRAPCTLAPPVERLVKLITDETMMKEMLQTLEYDIQRAPLGALKSSTLDAGSAKLKEIELLLDGPNPSKSRLSQLSSEYYTLIPHAFGRKVPPVISTKKQIAQEMELLRALADVQTATKTRKEQDASVDPRHPLDVRYEKLNAQIAPVTDEKILGIIGQYVSSTHASTHPHNEYVLEIEHVYSITRPADEEAYAAKAPAKNRQLLWQVSTTSTPMSRPSCQLVLTRRGADST